MKGSLSTRPTPSSFSAKENPLGFVILRTMGDVQKCPFPTVLKFNKFTASITERCVDNFVSTIEY